MVAAGPVLAQGQCLPAVTAQGGIAGPSQSDAERVARNEWRGIVARNHGREYADWDAAAGRKMECITFNEDSHQCWATASPCRSARLLQPN